MLHASFNVSHKEMVIWCYYDDDNFDMTKIKKLLDDITDTYEIIKSEVILLWKTVTYKAPSYITIKTVQNF